MQAVQLVVPLLRLGRGDRHSLGSVWRAGRWRALCNGKWELEVLVCSCTEAIFLGSKHGLWAPHLLMSTHLTPGAQLVLGVMVNRSLTGFLVFCFENITRHGTNAEWAYLSEGNRCYILGCSGKNSPLQLLGWSCVSSQWKVLWDVTLTLSEPNTAPGARWAACTGAVGSRGHIRGGVVGAACWQLTDFCWIGPNWQPLSPRKLDGAKTFA